MKNFDDIDDLFRNGLGDSEVKPPADLWGKIDQSIEEASFEDMFKQKLEKAEEKPPRGIWAALQFKLWLKSFLQFNLSQFNVYYAAASLAVVSTGAVVYDASLCVGCRYCMVACPFNIPAYEYNNPFSPKVMKCNLCHPLIEKGQLPGCVDACPKDALVFGSRERLIKTAKQRIRKYPNRYIDHLYGEKEMGGTGWLYLSGIPFSKIGMREDLGIYTAQQFTAGPLSAVPIVVGLWPLLLTGIYAISKQKEKIAEEERISAVARTVSNADEELKVKLAELKDKMTKEKEAAINLEVKKALEEANKAKEKIKNNTDMEPPEDKSGEEQ